jgi:GNAT superfamily N-acetyltransferase
VLTELLALYDADERFSATYVDTRREQLADLVRHVALRDTSSIVLYSRLSADTVEAAIQEQVAYFGSLGHEFEWKAYAHDQPPDLVERLARHGFEIDDAEAIVVLDLSSSALPAASDRVRKLTRSEQLRDVAPVKARVDGGDVDARIDALAYEMEHTPDGISVYVADFDGAPVACGWVRFPRSSAFASLWGGSTVPELRNRGLYTDLVAARALEARGRGFRYLTCDARSTSRPILEKRGFQLLTYATACTWSALAADGGV